MHFDLGTDLKTSYRLTGLGRSAHVVTALASGLVVLWLLSHALNGASATAESRQFALLLAMPLVVLCILKLRHAFFADSRYVELDDEGFTWFGSFRPVRLRWEDVTRYRVKFDDESGRPLYLNVGLERGTPTGRRQIRIGLVDLAPPGDNLVSAFTVYHGRRTAPQHETCGSFSG